MPGVVYCDLAHFSSDIFPFPSIWTTLNSLLGGGGQGGVITSQKVDIANQLFLTLCFKGGN